MFFSGFKSFRGGYVALLCFAFSTHLSGITFEIVIASYNNERWCGQNLLSAVTQDYLDFHVTYIDDCSTDATGQMVDAFVAEYQLQNLVTVIHNPERRGCVSNYYDAIHALPDNTVAIILDGDDMLAHPQVLQRLNEVYSNYEVWMTFGKFKFWPAEDGEVIGKPYPDHVIRSNGFRSCRRIPYHLRTSYAWLFKRILREDLMDNGTYWPMAGDIAEMIPMLEMAGERHACMNEVLYLYNNTNPLSDFIRDSGLQGRLEKKIRAKKRYQRLDGIVMNPGKPAYYAHLKNSKQQKIRR